MPVKPESYTVLGLGDTGWSCVQHLVRAGHTVTVQDDRFDPPCLQALIASGLDVPIALGGVRQDWLCDATYTVMSPGLSPQTAVGRMALAHSNLMLSELDLFAQAVRVPYVAVTGTNGKSTVVTLLGKMLEQAGMRVAIGGNIGRPALSCLGADIDCVVLECSSFSLHYTATFQPKAAAILNISEDHLVWHGSKDAYQVAKSKIYAGTDYALYPSSLPALKQAADQAADVETFGAEPNAHWRIRDSGEIEHVGVGYLALPELSGHMIPEANYLASCALAHQFGVLPEHMRQALLEFKGLPHRCEVLGVCAGVIWVNDSKATNLDATSMAVRRLYTAHPQGVVVLIGGQLKNESWDSTIESWAGLDIQCVSFGEGAHRLHTVCLRYGVSCEVAQTLAEAIPMARVKAQPHQAILLSPGGASFDEFSDFTERGRAFSKAYLSIYAQHHRVEAV